MSEDIKGAIEHKGKSQLGERTKKYKASEIWEEREHRDSELAKSILANPRNPWL